MAAVAAALLAGCAGNGGGEAAPRATLPAPASTSSSAPAATTTTVGPYGADDPEFGPIWRHVEAVRYRAYTDPDPGKPRREILAEVVAASCPCFEQEAAELDELDRNGWHWTGRPIDVLHVSVAARAAPNFVVLSVVDQSDDEGEVLDRSGQVVRRGRTWGPMARTIQLARIDGAWLVHSAVEEGPRR